MSLLRGVVQFTHLILGAEVERLATFLEKAIRHALDGAAHTTFSVHHMTLEYKANTRESRNEHGNGFGLY